MKVKASALNYKPGALSALGCHKLGRAAGRIPDVLALAEYYLNRPKRLSKAELDHVAVSVSSSAGAATQAASLSNSDGFNKDLKRYEARARVVAKEVINVVKAGRKKDAIEALGRKVGDLKKRAEAIVTLSQEDCTLKGTK